MSYFVYLVWDDARSFLGQLLDLFEPPGAPDDLHASLGEHPTYGSPDAGARPGHQSYAVPPPLHFLTKANEGNGMTTIDFQVIPSTVSCTCSNRDERVDCLLDWYAYLVGLANLA